MRRFVICLLAAGMLCLAAACTPTTSSSPEERTAMWLRLGRCEDPGPGWGGVNWSNPGPRFQGGLGMASTTWAWARGRLADEHRYLWIDENAGYNPPDVQIAGAELVLATYGPRAWGCAGQAGLHR